MRRTCGGWRCSCRMALWRQAARGRRVRRGGGGGGGCSRLHWSGAPSGSLTTMGFGGEDEVGQARVAAFKDAAPGVKVPSTRATSTHSSSSPRSPAATPRTWSTWAAT